MSHIFVAPNTVTLPNSHPELSYSNRRLVEHVTSRRRVRSGNMVRASCCLQAVPFVGLQSHFFSAGEHAEQAGKRCR